MQKKTTTLAIGLNNFPSMLQERIMEAKGKADMSNSKKKIHKFT